MRVNIDYDRGRAVVGALIELWRNRSYPFDRAVLPQQLIPPSIRGDKLTLALFYFYACLLMRGGIESETAFRQLFKIHERFPDLFVPEKAQHVSHSDLVGVVGEHIGWDKKAISAFWIENSKRLVEAWGGNPLTVFRGVTTYEEAVNRTRNKKRKGDPPPSDLFFHAGFVGFQHKMTSMLLYFFEYEGLLPTNFHYPPPVDFHHCRLFLAHRILVVKGGNPGYVRYEERITSPIRSFLSWYIKNHDATTLELSDTLWLYSKLMCGEAPGNTTKSPKKAGVNSPGETPRFQLPLTHHFDNAEWARTKTKSFLSTCGVCSVRETCTFSIPARPYFAQGKFVLTPRARNGISVLPGNYILKNGDGGADGSAAITEKTQLALFGRQPDDC